MARAPGSASVRLIGILVPLFVFYVIAYAFLVQTYVPDTSKIAFLLKLIAGIVILGPTGVLLLRATSIRLWTSYSNIDWPLLVCAISSGALLVYLLRFMRTYLFDTPFSSPLNYYGSYTFAGWEFYAIAVLTIVYVYVEEIYFRGVIYGYLRERLSAPVAAAAASVLFMLAHLLFFAPYALTVLALSLLASWFVERTGTLFYGFVAHASLDLIALVLVTDDLFLRAPRIFPSLYILAFAAFIFAYVSLFVAHRDVR